MGETLFVTREFHLDSLRIRADELPPDEAGAGRRRRRGDGYLERGLRLQGGLPRGKGTERSLAAGKTRWATMYFDKGYSDKSG